MLEMLKDGFWLNYAVITLVNALVLLLGASLAHFCLPAYRVLRLRQEGKVLEEIRAQVVVDRQRFDEALGEQRERHIEQMHQERMSNDRRFAELQMSLTEIRDYLMEANRCAVRRETEELLELDGRN